MEVRSYDRYFFVLRFYITYTQLVFRVFNSAYIFYVKSRIIVKEIIHQLHQNSIMPNNSLIRDILMKIIRAKRFNQRRVDSWIEMYHRRPSILELKFLVFSYRPQSNRYSRLRSFTGFYWRYWFWGLLRYLFEGCTSGRFEQEFVHTWQQCQLLFLIWGDWHHQRQGYRHGPRVYGRWRSSHSFEQSQPLKSWVGIHATIFGERWVWSCRKWATPTEAVRWSWRHPNS